MCATRCSLVAALVLRASLLLAGETVLVFDRPQTAGICGYRALWDTPVVLDAEGVRRVKDAKVKDRGATAPWAPELRDGGSQPAALSFDAIHRSLLVRFPRCAEGIAAEVAKGRRVAKVELVLPFRDTELWPEGDPNYPPARGGYLYRTNWGVDRLYRTIRPQWHAVAWALRRPWAADPLLGPTYNAYIHGAGHWARFEARDADHDRFPRRFGPAEVSHKVPEGVLDVTPVLTHPAFGPSLGQRLRTLADCGFLVKKWETYDHRYYRGVYEWATATGGRAIVVGTPRLRVTLVDDPAGDKAVEVPPPTGLAALAAQLRGRGAGGEPTAVIPAPEEVARLAERFGVSRPDWMPDWQWARVEELARLGTGRGGLAADAPFWCAYVPGFIRERMARAEELTPHAAYERWVDGVLGRQPRGWYGFEAAEVLLPWFLFRQAMPVPMEAQWRLYWRAWLMPDRPTSELVHPMKDQLERGSNTAAKVEGDSYYVRTGDWRGNKSFFRAGFNYTISTMNFNHSAAMGALLGGSIIGSEHAMADGRHGLEHYPLRLWCWFDGSTQESIDHYYYAITVSGQKMVADFGPTRLDRLMGQSMLAKSIDELATAYHPGLRRFISSSTRTAINFLLVTQDGLQHMVHTLSRNGALHDLDNPHLPEGMPAVGREVPPRRVALQSLRGPWAPDFVSRVVDDKPIPFQLTAAYKQWGNHAQHPLWRRRYLGRHYGLASTDVYSSVVPIMAQWRREPKPVERMQEIATLLVRYGVDTTRLVNTHPGWTPSFGCQAALQHRNKLLVLASPYNLAGKRDDAESLQSTIGIFNYQPRPSWDIYVGDRKVESLPLSARASEPIVIRDGVTYLGIVPVPAADLGRVDEVRLRRGEVQEFGKAQYRAALVIDSFNYQKSELHGRKLDWREADRAYGGFAIELADAQDFPSFHAFRQHIRDATMETRWDPEQGVVHARYTSGDDVLEMACRTDYRKGSTDKLFVRRRVNGRWPYLPEGLERDTTVSQQGTSGRLEKLGAVLATEPGRRAYLLAEPHTGTYMAWNPLPELTPFALTVPGGIVVEADGKLGLARVIVRPRGARLWVDYAFRADQGGEERATALRVRGFGRPPRVMLNGEPLGEGLREVDTEPHAAYVIPLR
ncbi:MAG: hypothetical protein ACLF0G_07530 [Candidatus Brocadiia bacterium]